MFSATAQFNKVYKNPSSLRGYDLIFNDGKYYYSCGNAQDKLFFEIDPTDGSIISPTTKIGKYEVTGAINDVGKNSMEIFEAPSGASQDNEFVIPGTIPNPFIGNGVQFSFYNIKDNGSSFIETAKKQFVPGGLPKQNLSGYDLFNSEFHSYSDQVDGYAAIQDKMFFTGTRLDPNSSSSARSFTPFILRCDKSGIGPNGGTNSNPKFRYVPPIYNHEEVPTKIFTNQMSEAIISYGSLSGTGGAYLNNSVKRDVGIVGAGTNMWAVYSKTYHTTNLENNLGAGQSILEYSNSGIREFDWLVISSGNNPMDSSQNSYGHWDKDYFHLMEIDRINWSVLKANKIKLISLPVNGTTITYPKVQVSDVFATLTGIYITGSTTKKIDYNSTIIEQEKVFIIRLNHQWQFVSGAEYFVSNVNPSDVRHLHANKIKIINNEVFVVGSFESVHMPNNQNSFLMKTTLGLEGNCSTPITISQENATIVTRHRPTGGPGLEDAPMYEHYSYLPPMKSDQFVDLTICESGELGEGPDIHRSTTNNKSFGIDEFDLGDIKISILPNPAQNDITIKGLTNSNAIIYLLDIYGKITYEYSGKVSENHQLDVSNLKKGVYLIRITQEGQTNSLKLLKE
jgi:hypothetical protein